MRKLLLTTCTAALISIAGIAQEQDTTKTESNQYRNTMDRAEEKADSTSNDIEQGANRTRNQLRRGAQQAGDTLQQDAERTGNDIKRNTQQMRDTLEQDAAETGSDIQRNAEQTEQDIRERANQTGNDIERGADKTRNQIKNNMQQAEDTVSQSVQADEQNEDMTSGNGAVNQADNVAASSPVEVIDDKEGPNNEVVYKYQDEYYYVDRNEKKLVKVKEGDLKVAKHPVKINEGTATTDEKGAKKNNKKSKG